MVAVMVHGLVLFAGFGHLIPFYHGHSTFLPAVFINV